MGREALSRFGESDEEVEDTMAGIRASDIDRFALELADGLEAGKALIHGNRNQPEPGH